MSLSKTNEQAFEALIEQALVGNTREEREAANLTDVDAQSPADDKYYWGLPKDMDKPLAIDLRGCGASLRRHKKWRWMNTRART